MFKQDSSESRLPSKKSVEEIRRQMKDLGIDSITLSNGENIPDVGTKVSYIVKDSVERLSKASPKNVQEIAASQIQLLNSYYDLILDQARRSFRWALIAAGVGLIFLLGAVGLLLLCEIKNIAVFSLIGGSIVEVISGVNFYLYGKTSSQLANFHTRLDLTQRFLLANSLSECLEGEYKQKARSELIRAIVGLDSKAVDKTKAS
jgi:hypothetical protein